MEAATTHPVTAGGTTHRIYNYRQGGGEGEMGSSSRSPYEQGQRRSSVVVGMLQPLLGLLVLVLVVGVKVLGAMVPMMSMMNSGRISSLHGEHKVVS